MIRNLRGHENTFYIINVSYDKHTCHHVCILNLSMVLRLIVYLIDGINVVVSSHMTLAYAYADI